MKRHPHETTVLGIFKTPQGAHQAMDALEPLGYQSGDISFLANQAAYEQEEVIKLVTGDQLHQESKRAGKIGGLTGAVLAGATAVTAVLSGGTSLLAAGPLIAVLTGAGGILGGLINTGFSELATQRVDHALQQGEVVVLVHAANKDLAVQAQQTFESQGADFIHSHH